MNTTSDSGLVLTGYHAIIPNVRNSETLVTDALIFKVDKYGNTVSIRNNSESSIINKYSLSQNYPNPFNPSTIINYHVAVSSFISLKVFDILGKEVATLVNQKQNAGSYSVDFNGSNLPSGIYFYKLEANNFSITKRMLLIK